MRLYDSPAAPSPRRVRIFLAEKRMEVLRAPVDLRAREQFAPAFRAINPSCTVPVLELDDGTYLCESMAICRYLEARQPEPSLFGRNAKEQGMVEMWNRRVELEGYLPAADVLRNTSPAFADRALPGVPEGVPQIPALAGRGRATLARLYRKLEEQLAANEFIAGGYSVADITALVTVDFAARLGVRLPDDARHLRRWYEAVSGRPSATA